MMMVIRWAKKEIFVVSWEEEQASFIIEKGVLHFPLEEVLIKQRIEWGGLAWLDDILYAETCSAFFLAMVARLPSLPLPLTITGG